MVFCVLPQVASWGKGILSFATVHHKDALRKRVVLERYPQPQISKILQVADFRMYKSSFMRQLMNSGLLIAEGHGIWRAESDEIQWRRE